MPEWSTNRSIAKNTVWDRSSLAWLRLLKMECENATDVVGLTWRGIQAHHQDNAFVSLRLGESVTVT
jgi:hypothetical protein